MLSEARFCEALCLLRRAWCLEKDAGRETASGLKVCKGAKLSSLPTPPLRCAARAAGHRGVVDTEHLHCAGQCRTFNAQWVGAAPNVVT